MPVQIEYESLEIESVYATEEQFKQHNKFEKLKQAVLELNNNQRYITNIKYERFEAFGVFHYLYLVYHANVASLNGCDTVGDLEDMLDNFIG